MQRMESEKTREIDQLMKNIDGFLIQNLKTKTNNYLVGTQANGIKNQNANDKEEYKANIIAVLESISELSNELEGLKIDTESQKLFNSKLSADAQQAQLKYARSQGEANNHQILL